MSRQAIAKSNREAMPETARWVDAWRAVFGPDLRVLYAREGELERGTPSPAARSMDADQWLQYVRTGVMP